MLGNKISCQASGDAMWSMLYHFEHIVKSVATSHDQWRQHVNKICLRKMKMKILSQEVNL